MVLRGGSRPLATPSAVARSHRLATRSEPSVVTLAQVVGGGTVAGGWGGRVLSK